VHVDDVDGIAIQRVIQALLEHPTRFLFRVLIQRTRWNRDRNEKPVTSRSCGSQHQRMMALADKRRIEHRQYLLSAARRAVRNFGERVAYAEHGQRHECSRSASIAAS